MDQYNKVLNEALDKNLNEASHETKDAFIAGKSINDFFGYIQAVDQSTGESEKQIYDKMLRDGMVSSIINAYMSDLVVRDKITNHVCNVISDDINLVSELSDFLYNQIKIDDNLYYIALHCFCYGCAPTELESIDTVTDSQWELYIDSIKESFKTDTNNSLLESLKISNKTKFKEVIKETLKEDVLSLSKKKIKKRWYINLLSTWRLSGIESKGKAIAYIDPDDMSRVYDAKKLIPFMNRGILAETIMNEDGSDSFTITNSESFLKNAKTSYTVLSAFEDLLLIHALTTSINYRVFQVDVNGLGDEETIKLLQDIKKRINENESFNVENSFYNSSMTGVPMGASIIIPTRGGVGTLQVQQIDNQFGTDALGDFNHFKDKLANALMANPAILGNGNNSNGALATGAATEVLDDRAHAYIEKYRILLASNLENLCDLYLQQTRTKKQYDKIADFSIRMAKDTSRDQAKFLKAQEDAASSLKQIVSTLTEAGLKLENLPNTRLQLIRQFLGDELADTLNDELEKADNVDNESSNSDDFDGSDDFGGSDDFEGSDDVGLAPADEEASDESSDEEAPLEEPGVEI